MSAATDPHDVASALQGSIGVLVRRLRQVKVDGELSMAESAALGRIDREGPLAAATLARREGVSPQSMATILGALADRGLIGREADPDDGRRIMLSVTETGLEILRHKRTARTEQLARALSTDFAPVELEQLMSASPLLERLADRLG